MAKGQTIIFALIVILAVDAAADVISGWRPEICVQDCLAFRMEVQGATESACKYGCALGCEQLLGRGNNLRLDVDRRRCGCPERDRWWVRICTKPISNLFLSFHVEAFHNRLFRLSLSSFL
ncbi:hypothetical protein ACJRO7_012791 [Eucalyptus globulus]|uniref:Uncharacterized protein n=1 Tax=Eucalyptus globulus TaxID=34317 RepID=A0ABD3LQE0_EUCGL